jgi:hypothetical protein
MLRRVTLVIIDVSEERIASVVRVTRIGELGTMLAVTGNRSTLHSILRGHRSKNHKSYIALTGWGL